MSIDRAVLLARMLKEQERCLVAVSGDGTLSITDLRTLKVCLSLNLTNLDRACCAMCAGLAAHVHDHRKSFPAPVTDMNCERRCAHARRPTRMTSCCAAAPPRPAPRSSPAARRARSRSTAGTSGTTAPTVSRVRRRAACRSGHACAWAQPHPRCPAARCCAEQQHLSVWGMVFLVLQLAHCQSAPVAGKAIKKRVTTCNVLLASPGHPSSVDALAAFDEDTVLSGCQDGLIRVIGILPNKMLGVVGEHGDYPVERLALSGAMASQGRLCMRHGHAGYSSWPFCGA